MFTPGNRYCEWQGGHAQTGAMPFARTGRFTVTLTNDGNSDVNASLDFIRASGSGSGCATTIASTSAFAWRSAYLEAIGVPEQATFSYNNIPVAANSTRVIRFEMASVAD
ncbi:MAG: hypothetical protein OXF03_07350, partial [Gammaproteobacteria bacterium]|nr:hypothetical protein [Gammaproteobacteria bacterium]